MQHRKENSEEINISTQSSDQLPLMFQPDKSQQQKYSFYFHGNKSILNNRLSSINNKDKDFENLLTEMKNFKKPPTLVVSNELRINQQWKDNLLKTNLSLKSQHFKNIKLCSENKRDSVFNNAKFMESDDENPGECKAYFNLINGNKRESEMDLKFRDKKSLISFHPFVDLKKSINESVHNQNLLDCTSQNFISELFTRKKRENVQPTKIQSNYLFNLDHHPLQEPGALKYNFQPLKDFKDVPQIFKKSQKEHSKLSWEMANSIGSFNKEKKSPAAKPFQIKNILNDIKILNPERNTSPTKADKYQETTSQIKANLNIKDESIVSEDKIDRFIKQIEVHQFLTSNERNQNSWVVEGKDFDSKFYKLNEKMIFEENKSIKKNYQNDKKETKFSFMDRSTADKLTKRFVKGLSRKISKKICKISKTKQIEKSRVFKMKNFIDSLHFFDFQEKSKPCIICGKKFSFNALGGHMSREHPNKSDKFRNRMITKNYRKMERDRKEMINFYVFQKNNK